MVPSASPGSIGVPGVVFIPSGVVGVQGVPTIVMTCTGVDVVEIRRRCASQRVAARSGAVLDPLAS